MIRIILCCVLWVLPGMSPGQERGSLVARVGTRAISEQELIQRFELLPIFSRTGHQQDRYALLFSLIAEKLLAQEAERQLMQNRAHVADQVDHVRGLLARDELYRLEVRNKVTVTGGEVDRAAEQWKQLRLVEFLYTPDSLTATRVASLLSSGSTLARIAGDTTMSVHHDTATVIWGDADEAIEEAAYALQNQAPSAIVGAGDGFYILRLLRIGINSDIAASPEHTVRERAEQILRQRRERSRAREFVASVMQGKTGYARAGTLRSLTDSLWSLLAPAGAPATSAITEREISALREEAPALFNDTLAVAGPRAWTTGEAMEGLWLSGARMDGSSRRGMASSLNEHVALMVRQELLQQEALARGLDRRPGIASQVQMWRDRILADELRRSILDTVTVHDVEVFQYLEREGLERVPQVQIRELVTLTLDAMLEALRRLAEQGQSFSEVIRLWSVNSETRGRDGLSDLFPVTARPPVGEIAWTLEVGDRYGPVQEGDRYTYFELVAKEEAPPALTDSAVDTAQAARVAVEGMKKRRILRERIAGLAQAKGFDIYQDRVDAVRLSNIPMMSFRFLGFGGRMFALPFVQPEVDWVDLLQDLPVLP